MEELLSLISQTLNILVGISFDPSVPKHVKQVLHSQIKKLKEAYDAKSNEAHSPDA